MSGKIILPRSTRRPADTLRNQKLTSQYEAEYTDFADAMMALRKEIGFAVGSREYCYQAEELAWRWKGGALVRVTKPDFDLMETRIARARKDGFLPLNFTIEDEGRVVVGEEQSDFPDVEKEAAWVRDELVEGHIGSYTPRSFWESQDHFVVMALEKSGLLNLFAPVCQDFNMMLLNFRGNSDLARRAKVMRAFKRWEAEGKQCVLLYCGDCDPAGLSISGSLRSDMSALSESWTLTEEGKRDYLAWEPTDIIIDRFGINKAFIDAHLPEAWVPNLLTSSGGDLSSPKHPDHQKSYVQDYIITHGVQKCEASALVRRAALGRQLARDTILKYVDPEAASRYREDIETARAELRNAVTKILT